MKVITQGCKLLNDDCFTNLIEKENNDSYDKKLKLRYILLMDFTKCDYISDKMLKSLSAIYPKASFINYYGDEFCNQKKIYKD